MVSHLNIFVSCLVKLYIHNLVRSIQPVIRSYVLIGELIARAHLIWDNYLVSQSFLTEDRSSGWESIT